TPTTSSVSWPASRCPWDARTSAIEWVTGTDTGYASTPLASSRSRFSRRTRSCSGRSSVGGAAVSAAAGFWLTESILSRPPTSYPRKHTSELQSRENLVCRLLLEKKKKHDSACKNT